MNRVSIAILTLAMAPLDQCVSPPEPAYPSALGYESEKQLRAQLSDCNLVFVGELMSFETGWFGPTGSLAPSYQVVRYSPHKVLRGELDDTEVDVRHQVFGSERGLVQAEDGGPYRVDPNYYKPGVEFVVVASAPSYESFWVECSIWKATEQNVERITELLNEVPFSHPKWSKPKP